MGRLGPKDRNALLLHHFEGKELAEVAMALGLSPAAARKRLSRALEKLRRHFSRRGLTLSSEVLGGVVAGNVVAAMPPGFASIVAASSLAGLSTTTVTALTVIKTVHP
jgi:hypothetical protein